MKNFILGICFGTAGIAILSTISDIIVNGAELIKGKIGIEISRCNNQIDEINMPQTETRAIGFATTNAGEVNHEK